MTRIKKFAQLVGLGLATLGLVACGGSGSTDGGNNLTTQSGTGLMSLAVTDSPLDKGAKRVVVRFTHVELQPVDDGERVVIYFDEPAPGNEPAPIDESVPAEQLQALAEESSDEPVDEPTQGGSPGDRFAHVARGELRTAVRGGRSAGWEVRVDPLLPGAG